jgi:hypothetical protein
MKRKLAILGILFIGTIFLASTGPQQAYAAGSTVPWMEEPGSICTIDEGSCLTACYPNIVCCCIYQCPSGNTWVCKSGYCPQTSRSCME